MREQITMHDAPRFLGKNCWTLKEMQKGNITLPAGMEVTLQRCDGGACTIYARCACCGMQSYFHGIQLASLLFEIPEIVIHEREEQKKKEHEKKMRAAARFAKSEARIAAAQRRADAALAKKMTKIDEGMIGA